MKSPSRYQIKRGRVLDEHKTFATRPAMAVTRQENNVRLTVYELKDDYESRVVRVVVTWGGRSLQVTVMTGWSLEVFCYEIWAKLYGRLNKDVEDGEEVGFGEITDFILVTVNEVAERTLLEEAPYITDAMGVPY